MALAEEDIKRAGICWRRLVALSFVLTAVLFLYFQRGSNDGQAYLQELGYGPQAAFAIILFMTLAWAFALPASAFLFITPLLFPAHISTLITTTGSVLGTSVGYLVARYLGGAWAERLRGGKVARFLARHSSFLALFGVRLAPASPHGFINYAAGLARISFSRFLLATTVALSIKSYVYALAVQNTVGARSLTDALSWKTFLSLLAAALLSMTGHLLLLRFTRSEVKSLA